MFKPLNENGISNIYKKKKGGGYIHYQNIKINDYNMF